MNQPPRGRGRGAGRGFDTARGQGFNTPHGRGITTHDSDPGALNARYPTRGHSRGRGRARARGSTFNTSTGTYTPPLPTQPLRPRQESHAVPLHRSIHPNTPVSIILKADQPTGHRVNGIVADLLTRGDHPRGVKVRLRDGRVGRVQALVSEAEGERGEAVVGGVGANVGRDGENAGAVGRRGGGGMLGGRVERDIREEDEYLYDEGRAQEGASLGLFAALEDADRGAVGRKGRGKKGKRGAGGVVEEQRQAELVGEDKMAVATCPVCGDFEGDEAAVAHHVEEHFGS